MKKCLIFPLLLITVLSFSSFKAPKGSPVALNGKLQVTGTQLCNQKNSPLVLAGASLGWHNLWPRFYNENVVKWLAKDWKCNVIRASMGVGLDDSYLENQSFALQCITKVIDGAIRNGIYVIIDFTAINFIPKKPKHFSLRWQ